MTLKFILKKYLPKSLFDFFKKIYLYSKKLYLKTKLLFIGTKSYKDYIEYNFRHSKNETSSEFVPLNTEQADFRYCDVKLIAFYLPQFHSLPINDKWFGKGFTEWTNVAKAVPQYTGHYQPQLPIDMGFYNLLDIDVMKRQVGLAKLYGIYGFCFHYYWFSGTRLMEKPLFNWLQHPEIDFPFCLNWANENWTKQWDGGKNEIGYKQELRKGDAEKFFYDILPFFKDKRYISIKNKPIFLIYRPFFKDRDKFIYFIATLKHLSQQEGFDGLYLIGIYGSSFFDHPANWNLDALVEFPPHTLLMKGIAEKKISSYMNPDFKALILDGKKYIEEKKYLYPANFKLFKGLSPSWDNSPRRAYSFSFVLEGISPAIYQNWLEGCINYSKTSHSKDEEFIFINAWNEWAEGAHLEPDMRYGYAYLDATKKALLNKKNK